MFLSVNKQSEIRIRNVDTEIKQKLKAMAKKEGYDNLSQFVYDILDDFVNDQEMESSKNVMAPILNEMIKKMNLIIENEQRISEENTDVKSALTDMFEFFGMSNDDE